MGITNRQVKFVYRNGRIVRKDSAGLRRSARSVVAVHSDEMEPTKHMGTGAVLTSKAEFRRHTRASGAVEAGNDPAMRRELPRAESPALEPYVERALAQLNSR